MESDLEEIVETVESEVECDNLSSSSSSTFSEKKSKVYQHFTQTSDALFECKYCKKNYKRASGGSTSNLLMHLRRKHKGISQSKESQLQNHITQFFQPSKESSLELINEKLVEYVIMTSQPFHLVDTPSFIELYKAMRPDITLPSRTTLKEKVMVRYKKEKAAILQKLKNAPGKISLVIDCWKSRTQISYHGILAAWITNDWKFEEVLLEMDIIQGSHTGKYLAESLIRVLEDFGITDRILAITSDNASNCDTMFRELNTAFKNKGLEFIEANQRVRCLAHITNLACQDALSVLKLTGAINGDDYDHDIDFATLRQTDDESDDSDSETIPVMNDSIYGRIRNSILKIKMSDDMRSKFKKACEVNNIPFKTLKLDVKTRWNSTFNMLSRIFEMRMAYESIVKTERSLRKYDLDDSEWSQIKDMITFLKPFDDVTRCLSKAKRPTMSLTAAIYINLYNHLESYNEKGEWMMEAAKLACEKLNKYYPTSDGLVYIWGLVLDPRCKLDWYTQVGFKNDIVKVNKSIITRHWNLTYSFSVDSNTVNEDIESEDLVASQMKKVRYENKDDLHRYLSAPVASCNKYSDTLLWWKDHEDAYPVLSKVARDYLSASGTSVPIERVFSYGPDLLVNKRNRLTADTVRKIFCLRAWLKFEKHDYIQEKMNAITDAYKGSVK